GSYDIGGLVGLNDGTSTVDGSTASGSVSGGSAVAAISSSTASGSVTGGSGSYNIGGLVGYNDGTVRAGSASGSVRGSSGSYDIGGLVGLNDVDGTVSNSSAGGTVGGVSSANYGYVNIGGLVGLNNGSVSNGSASGTVDGGLGGWNIGGLVGQNAGTVSNGTASGPVDGLSGSYDIGGLVGLNDGTSTVDGSTASGSVSGGSASYNIGGLVGLNSGSIAFGSASGNVSGDSGTTAIGGLVGINAPSATISSSSASGSVGAGSSEAIGGLVGQNAGTISASFASGSVSGGNDSSYIGGLVGWNDFFPGGSAVIAFGSASGNVSVGNNSSYIGGLVGINDSGDVISASSAIGSVFARSASTNVGGLVGLNAGTITASFASGSVSADSNSTNVGGLVGWNDTPTVGTGLIAASYATGPVTVVAFGSAVGGLVGRNDSGDTISASYATGSVIVGAFGTAVGGLAGYSDGLIIGGSASGSVGVGSSSTQIGGLVGWNDSGGSISLSCYDCIVVSGGSITFGSGSVTVASGSSRIGGLVGENDGHVINTYSLGSVIVAPVSASIGGLVGDNPGTVTTSYSAGLVSASGSLGVGGLTGSPIMLTVGSFWDTTTSGQATDGDPNSMGLPTAKLMTEATYLAAGWDFSGVWQIGAGGSPSYPYFIVGTGGAVAPAVSPPPSPPTVPPVSPPPPPLGGTSPPPPPPPPPGTAPEETSTLDTGLIDTGDLLTPGGPFVESASNGTVATSPKLGLFEGAIEPVLEVRNSAGAVQAVCLSRDGNLLGVALADNSVRLFDLRSGTERFHISGGAGGAPTGAIVCGNPYLAGGRADGTITVWNALTGAKMLGLSGHSGAVDALALAPDESVLASGGADGTVRLWDPKSGKALAVLYGHTAAVVSLAISADGQSILSGGADGKAILWSRAEKRAVAVLGGHSGKVIAVGFNEAGEPVTTEDTGLMRVWPKDGRGQPRVFAGSPNPPAAEVAPGGRYVALAGTQGQASLYDTASGRLARGFAGPAGSAQFVLVDAAHQRLLTGGTDGIIRVWGLSDGTDMARMISTLKGWAVLDQQGRFDGSQQGVDDVSWVAEANLPIDNFSEKYYEPGLLAKVFAEQPVYVADAAAPLSAGVFPTPKSTLALSPGPYKAGQEIEITVTATDRGGGIAAQHLFHNGKLVPPDRLVSDTLDNPKDPKVRTSVYRSVLLAGANGFEAVSTSTQGVDGDAATAQIATVGAGAPPTLHVVTIGINTYYDARLDLDYGAPDALAMLGSLARAGTSGFAKVEEHRLTNEQATKANIVQLLKSLRTTKPEDEVVIYYAGHGEIVGKQWYMLPYDATLASEAEEVKSAISAADLRDAVVGIGANQILLFIDACKSGGSIATLTGALDRKVLRQVARDSGVAVIAASRPDQVAAELPTLGHGAFTYVMLEGLAGQADRDPGDGRITVSKLLKYSLETLPVVTEKLGTQPQVPVGYRRGTDFLIKTDVESTSSN
ncbi:MAG TPA: GLUG motif-containing protein, partial [Alphaproteobacteria bacterium]|nr:GLUG motif-containing protein [Alphaproteobacteria bacterium]